MLARTQILAPVANCLRRCSDVAARRLSNQPNNHPVWLSRPILSFDALLESSVSDCFLRDALVWRARRSPSVHSESDNLFS